MTRFSKLILLLSATLWLSACSSIQPARYAVSTANVTNLKPYSHYKAVVSSMELAQPFDQKCRMIAPIQGIYGQNVAQFMRQAFNDEFQLADIFDPKGIKIAGILHYIQFNSQMGVTDLTRGNWQMGLTLRSSNGHQLQVQHQYLFRSYLDPVSACNATSHALTPAVQGLIGKVIEHPDFAKLLSTQTTLGSAVDLGNR